jgi:hypothetical protein
VFATSPQIPYDGLVALSMRGKRRAASRESENGLSAAGRYREPILPLRPQINNVAAASTIPVTSAIAQAKTRKSLRIPVIAAPLRTRARLSACRDPAGTRSNWKYLQPTAKRFNGPFGSQSGTLTT